MLSGVVRGSRGMIATSRYITGDVIHRLAGRLTAHPGKDTLAMGPQTHVKDPRVAHIRKTESPSAVVLGGVIYARTRIDVGEEITVPVDFF
ncbi:MAG: hypothetical protein CL450_09125 [Acidimicrobiaceae bacterium]|nr:hypothetical protein [Acidimicrobiaceae bacterium]|tara:strand:+ start:1600 stop:1872 length:273 start_codon:yes stop_codon:yes gene_type:complete